MERVSWRIKTLLIPAWLVGALLVWPVPTSLGDGTEENVLNRWQGVYDRTTAQYLCRFEFVGGGYQDVLADPWPTRWVVHEKGDTDFTAPDLPGVIRRAWYRDPAGVKTNLGTWDNVAGFLRPFPARPVAYSRALVKALSRVNFNPALVGGPDLHPLPWLASHMGPLLQIDTRSDNDRLVQLQPGQCPRPMRALWRGQRPGIEPKGGPGVVRRASVLFGH